MATSRKTGKLAAFFLNVAAGPTLAAAAKLADTYDWRFESDVTMEECTRKGEGGARFMPGVGRATLNIQAHFNVTALLAVFGDDNAKLVTSGSPTMLRCAWRLVPVNADAVGATAPAIPTASGLTPTGVTRIEGFGWVTRTSLSGAHNALVSDEMTIQVDGEWDFGTT